MYYVRLTASELGVVLGIIFIAAILGGGGAFLALLSARALIEFPLAIMALAGLLSLVIVVYFLPLVVALAGIGATVFLLSQAIPVVPAAMITTAGWWAVANLVVWWSSKWPPPQPGAGPLPFRLWRGTAWWGARVLGFVCPGVLVLLLGQAIRGILWPAT